MKRRRTPETIAGRCSGASSQILAGSGFGHRRTGVGTYTLTFPWTPVSFVANSVSQGRAISFTITPGSNDVSVISFLTTTAAVDDQSFTFIATGPS